MNNAELEQLLTLLKSHGVMVYKTKDIELHIVPGQSLSSPREEPVRIPRSKPESPDYDPYKDPDAYGTTGWIPTYDEVESMKVGD